MDENMKICNMQETSVMPCARATFTGPTCTFPSPRGVGNPLNPSGWELAITIFSYGQGISVGHKLSAH